MQIDLYTHGFVVEVIGRKVSQIVASFVKQNLIVEKFKVNPIKQRYSKKSNVWVFAKANKDRSKLYLPIALYDEFLFYIEDKGILKHEYTVVKHQVHLGAKIKVNFIANFELTNLQKAHLDRSITL